MSKLSTSVELLDDRIKRELKPVAIANGYYNDLFEAFDAVKDNVRRVHVLTRELRAMHGQTHAPGPMSLCDPICRMVSEL